jgi:hypothetical protein
LVTAVSFEVQAMKPTLSKMADGEIWRNCIGWGAYPFHGRITLNSLFRVPTPYYGSGATTSKGRIPSSSHGQE